MPVLPTLPVIPHFPLLDVLMVSDGILHAPTHLIGWVGAYVHDVYDVCEYCLMVMVSNGFHGDLMVSDGFFSDSLMVSDGISWWSLLHFSDGVIWWFSLIVWQTFLMVWWVLMEISDGFLMMVWRSDGNRLMADSLMAFIWRSDGVLLMVWWSDIGKTVL